ncbi:MAG: hypothetical protein JWO35_822 [Candidatus Saccharibacteria bacterium]|nr:hypothetical protein [Candidatus Saccharibacteria bacterium]
MKHINIYQKLVAGYFGVMVVFWLFLFLTHRTAGDLNYLYSFLFGLIPLAGGVVGMAKASIWGGLKSALGKAVFFVSFGLVLWGLGETIWSYYNFVKHVPAPYPSLADIGFAPSIFFWVLGIAFLSIATGALFALKKSHVAKAIVVIAPILLLIPSYYLQIKLARGGTLVPPDEPALKTVLDIVYPFGDFLALTLAAVVFILSYRYFGGFYRRAISFILAGSAVMYIGDSVFSYTTTKGTYYNANWGDLILTVGLFLITFGILAFASKPPTKVTTGAV